MCGRVLIGLAVTLITAANLPIWSISFVNPTMARLKNAGPPKTHHGHPEPLGPRTKAGR